MAFKFQRLSQKEVGTSLSEINVTPLVDVMLVLLIIFMVTAPMMKSGIGVNLPQAETQSAPSEDGLTITITKDMLIYMEDTIINQFLLEEKLKAYFMGQERKVVFIKADKDLLWGFGIHIMDIIKKAGIETIGIIAEPKELEKEFRDNS
ncbi:MAG: biopolymer transporter ExbD [Candidatus Aminicenantes bacterium]|nr:biopolymer transporter ExbD [Candidatus Aminicenantes bacterium]